MTLETLLEGYVAKAPPRPKCPECGMNMLMFTADDGMKKMECLRCGHTDVVIEKKKPHAG